MNTNFDTYSVTDLRHNTKELLKQATNKGIVYLVRNSHPEAALINLNYLNALKEAYENYLDILEFDKTINLKRIPLKSHKKAFQRK